MAGKAALLRAHARTLIPPPLPADLLEAALPAARARAVALALLAFVGGFLLDDLRVLRVPGFAVGIASALLLFVFGSTVLARHEARRLSARPHAVAMELARRRAARSRLGAVGAALAAAAWLVLWGGASWLA